MPFNYEEVKDDPDFNTFINGLVAKKQTKWEEDHSASTQSHRSQMDEVNSELAKARASLASTTEQMSSLTGIQDELKKKVADMTVQASTAKLQNSIMAAVSKRSPKNLQNMVTLLTGQSSFNDEGALMIGDKPAEEALEAMVNGADTAYLFGGTPKKGSGLDPTSNATPAKTDSEQLRAAGF